MGGGQASNQEGLGNRYSNSNRFDLTFEKILIVAVGSQGNVRVEEEEVEP